MLAPARAMVEAVSLRLSLMAPRRSIWLPLALRLPVNPRTLPSPMLGLFLLSATDVVSTEKRQALKNTENILQIKEINVICQEYREILCLKKKDISDEILMYSDICETSILTLYLSAKCKLCCLWICA